MAAAALAEPSTKLPRGELPSRGSTPSGSHCSLENSSWHPLWGSPARSGWRGHTQLQHTAHPPGSCCGAGWGHPVSFLQPSPRELTPAEPGGSQGSVIPQNQHSLGICHPSRAVAPPRGMLSGDKAPAESRGRVPFPPHSQLGIPSGNPPHQHPGAKEGVGTEPALPSDPPDNGPEGLGRGKDTTDSICAGQ